MTPFLEFRLWLRRAPIGERLFAATVGVVVLAVAAWSLVSVDTGGSTSTVIASGGTTGAGSGGGTTTGGSGGRHHSGTSGTGGTGTNSLGNFGGTTGTTGSSISGSTGGSTGVSGGGSSGATGGSTGGTTGSLDRCAPRGSTDQGVTATEIHIDVVVADLAGSAGNGLVGLPSADQEISYFDTAIAHINKAGGLRCRKLVAKYYKANALNTQSLQKICFDIVGDKPFALLDEGLGSPAGSPVPRDCPPSHKVPSFGSLPLSTAEIAHFAPYLFGYFAPQEEIVHTWVMASARLGWFKGYRKIGVLTQDCNKNLNTITLRDLARLGIPSSKITTFNFGCPNQIPPPNKVQAAVLQFKQQRVSHVMDDAGIYENYFSKVAANEAYHPKYSVGDQGTIALWNNKNFGPDPQNFDGALAITETEYGAEHTAGVPRSEATKKCDAIMTAGNKPSSMRSPDGFSGVVCSLLTMFTTAVDNAPTLQRSALALGLDRVRQTRLPYPAGLANFSRFDGQVGGGYWRPDTYVASCACFRVQRPTFSRVFS